MPIERNKPGSPFEHVGKGKFTVTPVVAELAGILISHFPNIQETENPFDKLQLVSSIGVDDRKFLKTVLAGDDPGFEQGLTPGQELIRRNLVAIEAGLRGLGNPLNRDEAARLCATTEMGTIFRIMISSDTFLPVSDREDRIWAHAEAIRESTYKSIHEQNMDPQAIIANYVAHGMDFTLVRLSDPVVPSKLPNRRGPKRKDKPVEK